MANNDSENGVLDIDLAENHTSVTYFAFNGLKYLGRHFYVVHNSEAYVEHLDDMPKYEAEAAPFFITFILLEWFVRWWKGRGVPSLADGLASVSTGLFLEFVRMAFRGIQHSAYIYIHRNYCLYELPWDSPITWYVTALAVDLGYYWGHRAAHEINLFWAHHQTHHSSDHYTLASALRQGPFQSYCLWIFYLPMAFFIPPTQFLLHSQFNLLYQFWIHTEIIDNMGPLEYILNTPSHHRVHHGSNPYCIDKNYAGVLIIWDRMFGTFVAEKKEEKLVYGLIGQVKSANPLFLVSFHVKNIYTKFWSVTGWRNKLAALLNGPGWKPGSPRLGWHHEIPPTQLDRKPYSPHVCLEYNIYLLVHFFLIIFAYQAVTWQEEVLNPLSTLLYILYFVYSLTCIGMIFDNRPIAPFLECIRCVLFVVFAQKEITSLPALENVPVDKYETCNWALQKFFSVSAIYWGYRSVTNLSEVLFIKTKKL